MSGRHSAEYMREYMRRRRAAERERAALLAPSRPQPNDPAVLVSFRRRLRETTDPEAAEALRRHIIVLEKLYHQRPGGIVAGEAILPSTGRASVAGKLVSGFNVRPMIR